MMLSSSARELRRATLSNAAVILGAPADGVAAPAPLEPAPTAVALPAFEVGTPPAEGAPPLLGAPARPPFTAGEVGTAPVSTGSPAQPQARIAESAQRRGDRGLPSARIQLPG